MSRKSTPHVGDLIAAQHRAARENQVTNDAVPPRLDGAMPPGEHPTSAAALVPPIRPSSHYAPGPKLVNMTTRCREDQREWVRVLGIQCREATQEALTQQALDLLRMHYEPGWVPPKGGGG